MNNEKKNEVIRGIELVKALRDQAVKANKPASMFVRALSNLSDYFAAGNLDKCEEILSEVANA